MNLTINGVTQSAGQASVLGGSSPNSPQSSAPNTLQPSPILTVDSEQNIIAPLIEITKLDSENISLSSSETTKQNISNNANAVREISSQQQTIEEEKVALSNQQREISDAISQLERKESELQIEKLKLQQSNFVGGLINISV